MVLWAESYEKPNVWDESGAGSGWSGKLDTAHHPPSLPWKSPRHLTHLAEHSEKKTKHLVQFHLFTDEETAQKCDIVVTVVAAELPPVFLSPFRSAQWERICGSTWPNSECRRRRVLVQNMWPFFSIADDSLFDGPFPFSCLFLNCFSCYWKHFLCGSNIFSEPWGQIAAV